MQKTIFVAVIAVGAMLAISSFTSPKGVRPTGNACLGQNNDSLVEYIGNHCQAGDTIATKHPAYFCDFNHTVAHLQLGHVYLYGQAGGGARACCHFGVFERPKPENWELISFRGMTALCGKPIFGCGYKPLPIQEELFGRPAYVADYRAETFHN